MYVCAYVYVCVCMYVCVSVCVCVCILAFVIQHAKRMRRIILPSVGCLSGTAIFFHIISQTARFSGEKIIEHKMLVLIFSMIFVSSISHS